MNLKSFLSLIFKLLNILFVWITIALLLIVLFKKEWFELFFEWFKTFIIWLWYWNFLLVLIISIVESFPVLWVVVPGQQAMLIVWWVFGKIHLFPVIMCASLWALIWNYIWFHLWMHYGDKFFSKYWNWFWVWTTEIKYIKNSVIKHGAWFVIFWKFHNTTRAFVPFIVWSMNMNKKKFWIYNFIWSILWSAVIVVLWTLFVEYYKQILEYIGYIFTGIFVLFGIYIYFFKKKEFKTYMTEKELEIEWMLNIKGK